MRPSGTKFLAGALAITLALMILNGFVLHRLRVVYAPASVTRARWFDTLGQFHELVAYVGVWRDLATQNADLQSQLREQQAQKASIEALKQENDLLRKSLNLKTRLGKGTVPAGLYNISLTPTGYAALINQGSQAGLTVGSTVVSPDGILIGTVSAVFPSSARVTLVSDPTFKVTVKVLDGQTSGIARGALADGMSLDLVVQTDQITEGDTLVSTGDDLVPAGFIVGTVSNVRVNDTQLFKQVKIKPAASLINSHVIVIVP